MIQGTPIATQGMAGTAQVIQGTSIATQGMAGTAQVIQGGPITMSHLSDLGHASVVQLTPIGYAQQAADGGIQG